MSTLIVKFERIGRRRDVPLLRTPDDHPDLVAEAVWRYAGKYLGSRDYDVDVKLPTDEAAGAVSIGWGRFGVGTITRESDDSGRQNGV